MNDQVRILVADDDVQDLENLMTVLQNEGYLVDGVSNGRTSLREPEGQRVSNGDH